MTPIVDLSYQKNRKETHEEDSDTVKVAGSLYIVLFSLFLVFMFFYGLCGGRFW